MAYSNYRVLKTKRPKKIEIHLVKGKNLLGERMFTYLAIYAHRVRDFKLSLMRHNTDLEKYGVILETGLGEPSKAVQENIFQTYLPNKLNESEN